MGILRAIKTYETATKKIHNYNLYYKFRNFIYKTIVKLGKLKSKSIHAVKLKAQELNNRIYKIDRNNAAIETQIGVYVVQELDYLAIQSLQKNIKCVFGVTLHFLVQKLGLESTSLV